MFSERINLIVDGKYQIESTPGCCFVGISSCLFGECGRCQIAASYMS